MKYFTILLLTLLSAYPSFAQSDDPNKFIDNDNDNPPNWCRNGNFPSLSKNYQFGQIKQKTRLINDSDSKNADACPSEDVKKCPIKKSIEAKKSVIISKKLYDFYCVYNPSNGSSGWVSEKSLDIAPPKEIQFSNWIGSWSDGQNKIEIKKNKSGLYVSGEALWFGITLDDGSQVVHAGELDFIGQPDKDKLVYLAKKQYDCGAELINLGKYLVVRDNGSCGGVNVRFNGIYQRK